MDSNKQREIANQGQVAHWVQDKIAPYLSNIETTLLSELKNIYRDDTKEKSNSVLLAKLAGLCVIDDLKIRLNQDIKLGGVAHKELLK